MNGTKLKANASTYVVYVLFGTPGLIVLGWACWTVAKAMTVGR